MGDGADLLVDSRLVMGGGGGGEAAYISWGCSRASMTLMLVLRYGRASARSTKLISD